MGSVGLVILMMLVGALICAKARVAGGAILFAGIALVLFVATPIGSGMPEAISTFMSAFDDAATPALNGETPPQGVSTGSGS